MPVRASFTSLTVIAGLPGDHDAVRLRAVGQQLHLHVLGAMDVVLALLLPEHLSALPRDTTWRGFPVQWLGGPGPSGEVLGSSPHVHSLAVGFFEMDALTCSLTTCI